MKKLFNVKEYRKKYYLDNKEKIKEKVRLWVKNNKEKSKKYMKEYREKPKVKERMKEWTKEYNQKPEIKEKNRTRSKENYKTDSREEYLRNYITNNKEEIRRNALKYSRGKNGLRKIIEYRNNPNTKKKMKIYKREWMRRKLKEDLNFAIKHRLRRRLNHAMNIYIKEKRYIDGKKFNLDFEKIIKNLKPFPEDISKYHIDHIKPLCSFNLINPNEVRKAFAPENHQWLTIQENLSKGGRITNEE